MAINNIASTSLEKSSDSCPTYAAAQMPGQFWDELPCTDEGRRTSTGDGTCAPAQPVKGSAARAGTSKTGVPISKRRVTCSRSTNDVAKPDAPDINDRVAMTETVIDEVLCRAHARGVQAVLRRRCDGEVDEIALWDGGPTTGAVFRPKNSDGLAVWLSTKRQLHVADAAEAMQIIAKEEERRTRVAASKARKAHKLAAPDIEQRLPMTADQAGAPTSATPLCLRCLGRIASPHNHAVRIERVRRVSPTFGIAMVRLSLSDSLPCLLRVERRPDGRVTVSSPEYSDQSRKLRCYALRPGWRQAVEAAIAELWERGQ